jgi:hypothetical protein
MSLDIIAAESLGVRGLCCVVTLPGRRIVIDPGVALGYLRHGLLPHPLQIAVGRIVRAKIVQALSNATDVVLSHFHGDHVPLAQANPYQLAMSMLPERFGELRCWSKSGDNLNGAMAGRFADLAQVLGDNLRVAEASVQGPLAFSPAVPHGEAGSRMGTVMMTRITMPEGVFVHASDIQLLDDATVDRIIDWQPDILLAGGPPIYLERLGNNQRRRAWNNALRLARHIGTVIIDHHLLRNMQGATWLTELSKRVGRRVLCAADFMGQPRQMLEARRQQLYQRLPVAEGWHDDCLAGLVDPDDYLEPAAGR